MSKWIDQEQRRKSFLIATGEAGDAEEVVRVAATGIGVGAAVATSVQQASSSGSE